MLHNTISRIGSLSVLTALLLPTAKLVVDRSQAEEQNVTPSGEKPLTSLVVQGQPAALQAEKQGIHVLDIDFSKDPFEVEGFVE